MHVACAALHGLKEDEVHEIDERRLLSHPVNVISLDRVEVVLAVRYGRKSAIRRERLSHSRSGRSVPIAHQVAERGTVKTDAAHRAAGDSGDFIDRRGVERIDHRDEQALAVDTQRHGAEAHGDFGSEEFSSSWIR